MEFEFATANRIIFGAGVFGQLGALAGDLGRKALVTCGQRRASHDRLAGLLADHGVTVTFYTVRGEPSVDDARQAVRQAQEAGCDLVIGFGASSMQGNPIKLTVCR